MTHERVNGSLAPCSIRDRVTDWLRSRRIARRTRSLAAIRANKYFRLVHPLGCTDSQLEREVYGDNLAYREGVDNAA